ncbi:histone H3.3-like [Oopsacas minuta]|uniref:Histone H3.3-like n=1 Tax=Oopsacas minuta TaxID=111878 RepID=A0AAV7JF78_9METZ|nr:histone H3.3-like [Oopsacas minuta]
MPNPNKNKRKRSLPKKSKSPPVKPEPKPKPIQKLSKIQTRGNSRRIIQEIKYYQKSTHPLIFRGSFYKVVIQICRELQIQCRWNIVALEALQEALELYLVMFLSDANLLAYHTGRVTLFPRDIQLLQRLRSSI